MVEVAIDTASDLAGVALSEDGALLAELTWRTRQNHSRELLPALEWLLERAGLKRDAIAAVFVCLGPGSYAGLRVGLSTAKALAYALDAKLGGVGRLEADALPLALDRGRRVVAVHAAGRAELAWAAYARDGENLIELVPPRLNPREDFLRGLKDRDLVCGDLDQDLREAIGGQGATWVAPAHGRVRSVAELGWRRLQRGEFDSVDGLVPLYLREPAIGPQQPRGV